MRKLTFILIHYSTCQSSYKGKIKQHCHIIKLCRLANISFVLHGKICKGRVTKFWIRYGTGDHTRYLSIHIMYEKLGARFCSVQLNAHFLTGCDMTGKVGTRESAIKVKPDKFFRFNWWSKFSVTIWGVLSEGCFTYNKMYTIWLTKIWKLHQ